MSPQEGLASHMVGEVAEARPKWPSCSHAASRASWVRCFPASMLLQMRPALPEGLWPMLVHLSGAPRCSCLVHLPCALGTCIRPLEGPVHCTKFTQFKTSAWVCAYYVLSGRIGGVLMTAARRELDALNGLCTLCSPHNVDEAENILALIFGIWNISFFKQTLYL